MSLICARALFFRERGAEVHVWGTRPTAADYTGVEGSDLEGLAYAQVDVGDRAQIDQARAPDRLDILVLCQGTVVYKRGEFQPACENSAVLGTSEAPITTASRQRGSMVEVSCARIACTFSTSGVCRDWPQSIRTTLHRSFV